VNLLTPLIFQKPWKSVYHTQLDKHMLIIDKINRKHNNIAESQKIAGATRR